MHKKYKIIIFLNNGTTIENVLEYDTQYGFTSALTSYGNNGYLDSKNEILVYYPAHMILKIEAEPII